jgi:hypothetical protein
MLVALITTHCLFARLKHSSDIVLYENVIFIIFQFGIIGSYYYYQGGRIHIPLAATILAEDIERVTAYLKVMACYGYGSNNEGWKEYRKYSLAKILKDLINDMEGEGKFVGLREGQKSYVEVDEPYRGVNIRNIRSLERDHQYELIERADKRYLSVMILGADANYLHKNV